MAVVPLHRGTAPLLSLTQRVSRRIIAPRFPNGAIDYDPCHTWEGSASRSGYRTVCYPTLKYRGKMYRVNRLVLILEYGTQDIPRHSWETFDQWFARALEYYKHREASHSCDHAPCVNFTHLEWKGHRANVQEQVARRRQA